MSIADDPFPPGGPPRRLRDADSGSEQATLDLGTDQGTQEGMDQDSEDHSTSDQGTDQGSREHGNLIGGEWCAADSGEAFESRDPADDRIVIGTYASSDASDVAVAVRAAEDAAVDWRRTPAPRRGEILYAFGALLTQHKERLARHMSREMGKVLDERPAEMSRKASISPT